MPPRLTARGGDPPPASRPPSPRRLPRPTRPRWPANTPVPEAAPKARPEEGAKPDEKPAEADKPAASPKADASATDEMLKSGNAGSPPPGGLVANGSPTPAPGASPAPAPSSPPAANPAPPAGGGATPAPEAAPPAAGNAPNPGATPAGGSPPGRDQRGRRAPSQPDGASGLAAASPSPAPGGGGAPGAPGGGGPAAAGLSAGDAARSAGGQGAGGQNALMQGIAAFNRPNTAVMAFLAALKAKDKERLAQCTALHARTEAAEKHRKIFAAILDSDISDDELDEMSKTLDGYQVSGFLEARSTGAMGILISKMDGRDRLQRTVMTRKEKEGWKVLDVDKAMEFKFIQMPTRGRRR